MNQPQLEIVSEINDGEVIETLAKLPDVRVTQLSEPAAAGNISLADVLILDDRPEQNDSIRRLQELKQLHPATEFLVISTDKRPQHIVNLMKAGASGYIGNPLKVIELVDAIEEIRQKRRERAGKDRGGLYSFVGSKGGLGSTVLAVNTATALCTSRQPVLLCDLSLQSGDASVLLDAPPVPNIVDLTRNLHRLDNSLFKGAVFNHESGLNFLAAPQEPEESSEISADQVGQILTLAKQLYAHVIVDCPAMSVDDCSLVALRNSEQVFIVSDLSVTAVRNASRYARLIEKLGVDPARIRVVINRYIKGSTLAIDEVEATLKRPIFWLFPNDFGEVVSSINRGIPLVKLHAHSPLAKNIGGFVSKLQNPAGSGTFRGLKGTFGKAI